MSKLQQGLFLALLKTCSWLPLPVARCLGRLIAALSWYFNGRNRHVTEVNLRHCYPDMDDHQRLLLARNSYEGIAEGIAEMGTVWLKPASRVLDLVEEVRGEGLFDEAVADGKGAIVLIPHLGNWEVIGLYLANRHATTSLFELSGREVIDSFVQRVRSRNGATLVPTNQKGIVRLLKNLRQGQVTAILPDQLPRQRTGGEYAPFFGHRVLTMTLVSNLLQRTEANVLFGFALRTSGGFKIVFMPADPALKSADINESLAALNHGVEQCIAICPHQYSWEYKRFRDRPKAKTSIYDKDY